MNKPAPWKPSTSLSRLALAVAALLAGVTLAACGGDDEEEAARDVEEVIVAYGESDGAAACEFLSASALDQLGGESGCTRQFEGVGPAELTVMETTIEDDTATAQVENTDERGGEFELELVNEDDEWRISVFPGLEPIAPTEGPLPPPGGEVPPPGGELPAPGELPPPASERAPEGGEPAPEDEAPGPDEETAPE